MSRQTLAVRKELSALREEVRRIRDRSPFTFGTITDVDNDGNIATVEILGADGTTTSVPATALAGSFPEVGHYVMVAMNGNEPVVMRQPGPMTSDPPAQVTGVTASQGIQSLLVTWDQVADFDVIVNRGWYEVQYDTSSGFNSGNQKMVQVAGTKIVVDGLTEGTLYYARVRAVDMAGQPGTWSSTVSATPTYVTSTVIADDSISTPKLQANSVVAGKIATGAITTSKLDADSVTAAKLAALSLEVGKYIRSNSYVAGTSGWSIDADGSAEFNNVTVRGSLKGPGVNLLSNGGNETAASGTDMMTNGAFTSNGAGWTAGSNTTLVYTGSGGQSGGFMSIKSNAAGAFSANTPTGTSGFPVTPGKQYVVTWYQKRISATADRGLDLKFRLYDSTGTGFGTGHGPLANLQGVAGGSTGSWVQITGYFVAIPGSAYVSFQFASGAASAANEEMGLDTVTFKEHMIGLTAGYPSSATVPGAAYRFQGGSAIDLTRDTGTKRTGSASYKVTLNSWDSSGIVQTEPVAAEKNRAYKWSFWTIRSGSDCLVANHMRADFWNGKTLVSSVEGDTAIMARSAWANYTFVAKSPSSTITHVTFALEYDYVASGVTGAYFLDDLDVQNVPLFDGGYVSADRLISLSDIQDLTGYLMPVGTVIHWVGKIDTSDSGVWAQGGEGGGGGGAAISGVPAGFIPCDGRAVSRTTWWRLFAVIGTIHGTGDGSTTFNVPDYRDTYMYGVAAIADTPAISSLSLSHGHTMGNHTHTYTKGADNSLPGSTTTGPSTNSTSTDSAGTLRRGRGVPLIKG